VTADLTTRLLAAIEETERIAQAAIRWSEGASEWADGENPDWVHIAHHDPTTVLRRCAVDRKIVERYTNAVAAKRTYDEIDWSAMLERGAREQGIRERRRVCTADDAG
jgi:hypothetical protein